MQVLGVAADLEHVALAAAAPVESVAGRSVGGDRGRSGGPDDRLCLADRHEAGRRHRRLHEELVRERTVVALRGLGDELDWNAQCHERGELCE